MPRSLGRFQDEVRIPGEFRLRLPWPMTDGEASVWLSLTMCLVWGPAALALWAGYSWIEPSPWRLAPALTWFATVRLLIAPWLHESFAPDDLDQRRAEFAAQDAGLGHIVEEGR